MLHLLILLNPPQHLLSRPMTFNNINNALKAHQLNNFELHWVLFPLRDWKQWLQIFSVMPCCATGRSGHVLWLSIPSGSRSLSLKWYVLRRGPTGIYSTACTIELSSLSRLCIALSKRLRESCLFLTIIRWEKPRGIFPLLTFPPRSGQNNPSQWHTQERASIFSPIPPSILQSLTGNPQLFLCPCQPLVCQALDHCVC